MTLTQDAIREVLSYDPETGLLFWKVKRWTRKAGARAGNADPSGYVKVRVGGKLLYAHRIAWLLTYGEMPSMIDHINGNRSDNRIANLRLASLSENSQNRTANRSNKTGLKGVTPIGDRFRAQIKVKGNVKHLGMFDTPEAAHAAYCVSAKEHFGEFARVS